MHQFAPNARLWAWVDGVGGFLLCLADRVRLGHAGGFPADVDVPLLGDVAQQHAVVGREADGHWLLPLHPATLDDRPHDGAAPLADGALIGLGPTVRLRFRRPHALSLSATLKLESRHRTQPHVDAVVLAAATCLFGPGETCHVVCPDWPHTLTLIRQGSDLFCQCDAPLEVDGRPCRGRAPLATRSRVAMGDFRLALEPVE